MTCLKKYFFIILTFVSMLAVSTNAAVRVFAQVDASEGIYVGESFGYHVIIDGDNKAGQANITPLAEYNPRSAGSRDVSQTSISVINGKTTQNVTKRYVMSYSLTISRAGKIQLPPVTVTVDGKSYQSNPVEVNILKPGTTDQLDLEVTLSERQCYVGQPIVMTVKFYISADLGEFKFNIPAFTGSDFYIEEPDASNQQAKEYDLGNGVVVRVSQHRTVHNNKESILLSFRKILIPRRFGQIKISPSTVSADIAVGRTRDFFSSKKYKRFMVSSKPLELNVSPLPEEGKPAGFYGLVGQYTISASAAPTKVNVGDPITLTVKVGGGRFLTPVQWPGLEDISDLANNFKIPSEKASPIIENGYKVFTQTIRVNNDKADEIPAIPLAYFNADKGSYEIAKTEAIKLEVSPTKILTGADLQGLDFTHINKEVEAIKKGLSANYEGLDTLENQAFSPLAATVSIPYIFIWAGPLVLLMISSLSKFLTHTTPEKVTAKRRRSAAGKAVHQLKLISSSTAGQKYELLALTMKQYIGDRFDRIAGSLTSNDCFEIIFAETQDSQISEDSRQLIASCEAAQYASTENNFEAVKTEEAIELIKTIEKKSRQ